MDSDEVTKFLIHNRKDKENSKNQIYPTWAPCLAMVVKLFFAGEVFRLLIENVCKIMWYQLVNLGHTICYRLYSTLGCMKFMSTLVITTTYALLVYSEQTAV